MMRHFFTRTLGLVSLSPSFFRCRERNKDCQPNVLYLPSLAIYHIDLVSQSPTFPGPPRIQTITVPHWNLAKIIEFFSSFTETSSGWSIYAFGYGNRILWNESTSQKLAPGIMLYSNRVESRCSLFELEAKFQSALHQVCSEWIQVSEDHEGYSQLVDPKEWVLLLKEHETYPEEELFLRFVASWLHYEENQVQSGKDKKGRVFLWIRKSIYEEVVESFHLNVRCKKRWF